MNVWLTSRYGFENSTGPGALGVVGNETDLGFPFRDGVDHTLRIREPDQRDSHPSRAFELAREIDDDATSLTGRRILDGLSGVRRQVRGADRVVLRERRALRGQHEASHDHDERDG